LSFPVPDRDLTAIQSVRTEYRRHRIAYRKRSTGSSPLGSGTSGGAGAGIRIVLAHS
jgi:hypothetical protein